MAPTRRDRLKVGIVANEFFDQRLGPMGGFGWAAARVARLFRERPELALDPLFLRGNAWGDAEGAEIASEGTRALSASPGRIHHWRRLHRERIGLLLCIDYRRSYRRTLMLLPRTPAIVWSRDPRDGGDWRSVATLRMPGSDVRPEGIDRLDCSSLAGIVRWSRRIGRRIEFVTPAPALADKIAATYGIDRPAVGMLPNPIDLPLRPPRKSATPVVLFLGRFDPIKRPWIFVELARRFPEAEFVMLGQRHFAGEGGDGFPPDLPSNLRIAGHLEGEEKARELERAWILVNTSIHEALPVSFQEALAWEIPIVSGRNPEGVAERFGAWVGQWDGTGLQGLDAWVAGIGRLLRDDALRTRLGREGRAWVERTHGTERFLDAFRRLATTLVPAYGRSVHRHER